MLDSGGGRDKVFNDAIHGAICLPSLCVAIIDTPQFQRLRFIKMLGSCYFVFPTAAHNRFEHSLGVCHLAGQLVRALRDRQPHLAITNNDVLCVMLAGLCHDLGHGPSSHLWEEFVRRARPNSRWKHEEASVKMFDHLLKENPHLAQEIKNNNLNDQDLTFIRELIGGAKRDDEGWPFEGRPRQKAFLYEVVANKRTGVDVDKWDYILRDGHSLGIKVTFHYDRLIQFSRVLEVEGEGFQLCVRDKEVNNLYDMFHARRNLHRTAYQHRVVKAIDAMLIDAFLYADKHIKYRGSNGVRLALGDVCEDMMAYTHLTDELFHRILLAEESHPELDKAKQILNNILTRKLYLYVGHTQPTLQHLDPEQLMNTMLKNVPKGSSLSEEKLGIQVVRLSYGMGDKDPIELVKFFSKREPNLPKQIRKEEISAMLPQSFQETVFRVVCKSFEEQDFKDAQEAFTDSCLELHMKKPSVDSWPSILTPVKGGQHTSPARPPPSNPAVKALHLNNATED